MIDYQYSNLNQLTKRLNKNDVTIYHAEARFYDAKNRQWMSSDSIKHELNRYWYVASNNTLIVT